jgi:hypothetical protein
LIVASAAVAAPPVADVALGPTSVEWRIAVESAGATLSVSGPAEVSEHRFGAGENPLFDLRSLASVADGLYTWELVVAPRLDADVKRQLAEARSAGDAGAEGRLRSAGLLPGPGDSVQSGFFRVADGAIVQDGGEEAGPGVRRMVASAGGVSRITATDQVIPDDLIVQSSLCVGFDCVNNENFGFDTIRLKENNTRIKFEDTSAGSFPSQDWQLTANDSASGGANKFSIDAITPSSSTPFTILAGAPSSSIFVDSTGRVGLRKSTPVLDLHIATGNTPAIRLEQTNASGFTAQTWDIAGNEANFFVRDVTGGSTLAFRIRPGAPTSSLDISANGNVGIGTASASRALTVIDTGATDNTVLEIQNNGATRLRINNGANGEIWNIGHQSPGGSGLVFSDVGDAVSEMLLDVAGNMTIAGQLVTGGPQCGPGTPCDLVFSPDFAVESIEDHAAAMWANSYLPAVGPTPPGAPLNLSERTGRILNELEKAHIYIEQLHQRNEDLQSQQSTLTRELAELKAIVAGLREQTGE